MMFNCAGKCPNVKGDCRHRRQHLLFLSHRG